MKYKTGLYYSLDIWKIDNDYGYEYKNTYKTLKNAIKTLKNLKKSPEIKSIMIRFNDYSINNDHCIIGVSSPYIYWENGVNGYKWFGSDNPYCNNNEKMGYIAEL